MEYQPFFNKTTFSQLKDAADAVLAREKCTSLAELFSVELKFTFDTLNDWSSNTTKPKFYELSDIKKSVFVKENPIVLSETICCICVFLLDVGATGKQKRWYDFIVDCEHLYLRSIYSESDLKGMEIETYNKYYSIFNKLVRIFPEVESALHDGESSEEFKNFIFEDLDGAYSTVSELREDIEHIVVPRKKVSKKERFLQ